MTPEQAAQGQAPARMAAEGFSSHGERLLIWREAHQSPGTHLLELSNTAVLSPAQPFPPKSSRELQLGAHPASLPGAAPGICLVANFPGYKAVPCRGCRCPRMLSKSWADAAAQKNSCSSPSQLSLPSPSRRQPRGAQLLGLLSSAIPSHGLGLLGCSATWLRGCRERSGG